LHFAGQQLAQLGRQEGQYRRGGFQPPGQAAQVGLQDLEVLGCQVHARQHVAQRGAVHRLRIQLRLAFELADDGRRLVVEQVDDGALVVGYRRRHGDAALRQMAHQFQVEGQLFDMQLFEQGQHIFALLRADEEVAVFDARGDTLDRGGAAERNCSIQSESCSRLTGVKTAMTKMNRGCWLGRAAGRSGRCARGGQLRRPSCS
jgi:hypothetical protein